MEAVRKEVAIKQAIQAFIRDWHDNESHETLVLTLRLTSERSISTKRISKIGFEDTVVVLSNADDEKGNHHHLVRVPFLSIIDVCGNY